jgi:hypothetical protein
LSTRPSPLAVVPALLLVFVSLWEVCVTPRDAAALPTDRSWQKAAALVRSGYQQGDLIVFAPSWIDPVGRMNLGDLISLEMAGRMDAARYGRIWEVSIRDEHARDVAGLTPTLTREIDDITVRFYSRTPVVVSADVREQLATAKVSGGTRPSLELAEVGFEPHRCIQVVPAAKSSVRITFPQMFLGTRLVGFVGLADVFTRRSPRGPGRLQVEIAGKVVATAVAGVDDGWVRFETATTAGPADVTFVASADDPQRMICFAAEARQ